MQINKKIRVTFIYVSNRITLPHRWHKWYMTS